MKAAVFGIPDFPFGKKPLPDERLKKIQELFHSQKTTQIQVEFTTQNDLKTADAIVCPQEKRLDLLILDMEVLEGRSAKENSQDDKDLLSRCQELLEKETPLSEADFNEEAKRWLTNNNFVTIKPVIFISKDDTDDLPALTRRVYGQGGMISFLTGGPKEARAWELRKNATAIEAAHRVHSDIARGFIRADVMAYEDLTKAGNVNQAKNEGYLHEEGKDYIVKDGDVIEFKFSV